MSLYKKLFQQTAIYGIATVVPRMFSFLLTPLYTELLPEQEYGEVSIIFAWVVLFNVILAYGMETAFFRFYTEGNSNKVQSTATVSVFWTSLFFLAVALLGRDYFAEATGINVRYVTYTIWMLVLDALVIIPFSKLRADSRPIAYAVVKIGNVLVNLSFNIFFLIYLPDLAANNPNSFISTVYVADFQIGYIFISNLIASLLTFIVLAPHYFRISWRIDKTLWKRMMRYSLPVLVAGIAFAVNETFDRILLENILSNGILSPADAKAQVGIYSACYKLAIFMTLFATAFRLGIEPFFFSHAKNKEAPQTYAMITRYFVIFGSVILLVVIVFADLLKVLIIRDEGYWEGMKVVPLIILANFFLGIYHNLSVWYKLSDRTKMGAFISIIGAFITLGLNYALIPEYSYMGSAVATITAYGTMMIISYLLGKRYYPIPYDVKKIVGYLGLSIALSAICFYFFRTNYLIGALAIITYAVFIYINEKTTLKEIAKGR